MRESDIRWLKREVIPLLIDVMVELRLKSDSDLAVKMEFLIHDIRDRIGE